MALQQRFKKTNPQQEKQNAENRSRHTGTGYSVFKEGITPYKFEEGSNLLRLLPQLAASPFPNYLDVSALGFFNEALPIRGSFRIMEEHNWMLGKMFKLLRAHSEFKYQLWSRENEDGVSFNARPKVAFLGFNINDPERKVIPIMLPGTLSYPAKDGKARTPQAGTRITQFVYDTDINGNLRYGDIFDIDEGRVVRVDVTNAGTIRVKYEPSVDAAYPISSASFAPVLDQVKNFNEVVNEPSMSELIKVIKAYLPVAMYEYLDAQINFDKIMEQTELDSSLAGHSEIRETVVTPEAKREAAVPLPEDDDDLPPSDPEDTVDDEQSANEVEERLAALREGMRKKRATKEE